MKLSEKKLMGLDHVIYELLDKNVDRMPMRFVKFIANNYTDARVRKKYLKRLGVEMGEGTFANLGFRLVSNNYETKLFIGNHVSIAPNVTFICDAGANNGIRINEIAYVKEVLTKSESIIVEDDVWIGANVTIMPGVRIGTCSVIGAGSVVTKNVDSYSVYAGVPARKIRSL